MKTIPMWQPVNPGDLYFTPIVLIGDDGVPKLIEAKDLAPGQTGWLAIDVPVRRARTPIPLEEALDMVNIGC